jgi:translation initiation factor 2A
MGIGVWAKLQLEGVSYFSLSPGKAPAVAVFIPEKKVIQGEAKRRRDNPTDIHLR